MPLTIKSQPPIAFETEPKTKVPFRGTLNGFIEAAKTEKPIEQFFRPGEKEYAIEEWNLLWAHHLPGAPFVWHYKVEGSWGTKNFAFIQEARQFLQQGKADVYMHAIRREGIAAWKPPVDLPTPTLTPKEKKSVGLDIYTLEQPIFTDRRPEWIWRISFWDGTKQEGMDIEMTEKEFKDLVEKLPDVKVVRVVDWVNVKEWGNAPTVLLTLSRLVDIFPELEEQCIRMEGGDRDWVCREDYLGLLNLKSKELGFDIRLRGKFEKKEEPPVTPKAETPEEREHSEVTEEYARLKMDEQAGFRGDSPQTEAFKRRRLRELRERFIKEEKVTMRPVWPPQPQKGKFEITGTEYKGLREGFTGPLEDLRQRIIKMRLPPGYVVTSAVNAKYPETGEVSRIEASVFKDDLDTPITSIIVRLEFGRQLWKLKMSSAYGGSASHRRSDPNLPPLRQPAEFESQDLEAVWKFIQENLPSFALFPEAGKAYESDPVRLNDPVKLPNGSISTIAKLLDEGKVKLTRVDNWRGRGVTAYFADLVDGSGSWAIGKVAYESRMGMKPFGEPTREAKEAWV